MNIKRNQSASLITVMITNKSDSADTSQKFVTPREKKIGDLAQVLERQRQTIKSLLSNKKEQIQVKRDHTVYMQIETKPKVQPKQPEKYQQLCDQIVNIGNKLLSARRSNTLQSYRDVNVSVELKEMREIRQLLEQKADTGDKEMEYLKSDQYRLYLQNLTKDQDANNADLLKRMKQTRNNNVYAKPTPTSKVFRNLDIKGSAREQKPYRQYRETQLPRNRQMLHHFQPISNGMTGRQKDYDRSLNVFEQISLLSSDNVNFKEMRHSPTMKDINKPAPFQTIHKKEQKQSRSVSKNNKIQSRTVDCLVFTGLAVPKSVQKLQSQDIDKKQIKRDSPKMCRHFKQWDLDVYKIDSSPIFKNRKKQEQIDRKQINKKYEKSNGLRECYSHTNIKKQTYKAQFSQTAYKKSKNTYETHQKKDRKYRVVTLEQSSHQLTDFSDASLVNIQNINLYELNFKLADPKIRSQPQHFQSKTPVKLYKQKTPSKVNEKQNIYFHGKNVYSYKQESVKTPQKQTTYKREQQNVIPYVIEIPHSKKWKLQESQATSTVTKSACDHQLQMRGHSRSKSKLSVVTASKKQKR